VTGEDAAVAGAWFGYFPHMGEPFRVQLTVQAGAAGGLAATVDSPDQGDLGLAVENLRWHAGRLTGDAPGWPGAFDLTLRPDGVLAGHLLGPWQSGPLALYRDHPDRPRYETPRLDERGEPVRRYEYRQPADCDDGWQTATPEQVGLDPEPLAGLMQAILAGRYPQAHSVVVVRRGRLVAEEYFYGQRRRKKHCLQSATKSVTAILVGIAVDQGLIPGVQVPIYELFPERRSLRWIAARYAITLWHVLTMQAGLAWNEEAPYGDPANDNTGMNLSDDWIGYVLDRGIAGPPGERYQYVSGLTILLGGIIRNATGMYVDEYAERCLFAPLGIRDYGWTRAPDGTRHTGGGLFLRPRDAAKIGQMMLDRGRWQGRRVVSEQWVTESTRQQTRPGDYAYGYQWHLRRCQVGGRAIEAFCAAGYGGQWIFCLPALDMVVVFNAGCYGGDSRPEEKLTEYVLPAAIRAAEG
jgi:CubicO group peptidase (beta-lactamase class C family)